MKNRLSGFAFGVLFTVLTMALIGTVAAAQMSRTAELYYRDIKVTLDGEEIQLLDAAGEYVEPFIIDGTTYLPVRAVANALGLEVGWDGATATVILTSENYRPQKNGFDGATNQKEKMGNYTFSVPSYWGENISKEADVLRYYAESNGKVAMLQVDWAEDTDPVSYEALVADQDNIAMAIEGSLAEAGGKVTGYEMFQGGDGTKGILYSYTMNFAVDGTTYAGTGKLFCYPSTEDNKWFYVWLASSDNTDYVYDDDFAKVLLTIKKDNSSQGSWIGGKTTDSPDEKEGHTSPNVNASGNSKGGSTQKGSDDMPNGSRMVYVTKTGKRYHYDSTCNGGTYYLTTLEDAQRRGLSPCQKCVLH